MRIDTTNYRRGEEKRARGFAWLDVSENAIVVIRVQTGLELYEEERGKEKCDVRKRRKRMRAEKNVERRIEEKRIFTVY